MILLQDEDHKLSYELQCGYDSTQEKVLYMLDNPRPYTWRPLGFPGGMGPQNREAVYQTVAAHSVRLQGKSVEQIFMDELDMIGSLPAFQ